MSWVFRTSSPAGEKESSEQGQSRGRNRPPANSDTRGESSLLRSDHRISAEIRKPGDPQYEFQAIVCTPEDAIDGFKRTSIDVLAIDRFVVRQSEKQEGVRRTSGNPHMTDKT